jgi:hypothetical protein
MKKIFLTMAIALSAYCSYAQYLPLTGGTLTGGLEFDASNGTYMRFNTGGNPFGFMSNTFNAIGSGSKNDFLTWIYGNNPYSIWTNGSNRLIVDGGGNVGIGTLTPGAKLHLVENGAAGSAALHLTNRNSNQTWGMAVDVDAVDDKKLMIYDVTSAIARFTLNTAGNVGIGTTSPGQKLHVNGITQIDGNIYTGVNNAKMVFGTTPSVNPYLSGDYSIGNLYLGTNGNNVLTVTNTGNVAIGTTDPQGYKLAINGNAIAESVTVKLHGSWPDYVFKQGYRLPSLTAVKTYIDKNQHLPDMPSGQDVAKNGINLGGIVKLQTKKIEELTLYLIEKDKQLTAQQEQLAEQQKINQSLQQQINQLAKKINN